MNSDRKDAITVIGCGGFIGSHLLDRLLSRGDCRVIGIDLAGEKIAHHRESDRFSFIRCDIHDREMVERCIAQSATVVLLAALCNPSQYNTRTLDVIDVNCVDTIPVVRTCAEKGVRLVYFSTCEVYGRTVASLTGRDEDRSDYLLREDESPFILGPVSAVRWSYACAKQLIERVIEAYSREQGLDYTIVRPFNFIGPRMDFLPGIDGEGIPRVLACFLSALMHGTPLQLVDGGKNRRCFTAIGDAIDACDMILDQPHAARNRIFNIGNPANETTIADLAAHMIRLWHRLAPLDTREARLETVTGSAFYGPGYEDSDRRVPDIGKAQRLLGWQPKIGLEEALASAMQAYIDRYGYCIGQTVG
jgi:UDP-apiose/xylose synthase